MHNDEIEEYFRLNSTVYFSHLPIHPLYGRQILLPTDGGSMRESQVYTLLKDNNRLCGIKWRVYFVKNENAVIDNAIHVKYDSSPIYYLLEESKSLA